MNSKSLWLLGGVGGQRKWALYKLSSHQHFLRRLLRQLSQLPASVRREPVLSGPLRYQPSRTDPVLVSATAVCIIARPAPLLLVVHGQNGKNGQLFISLRGCGATNCGRDARTVVGKWTLEGGVCQDH